MAEQDAQDRINKALIIIVCHGGTDGANHKAWVIDQVALALCGPDYDTFVADCRNGEDGPETYDWDVGTPP